MANHNSRLTQEERDDVLRHMGAYLHKLESGTMTAKDRAVFDALLDLAEGWDE